MYGLVILTFDLLMSKSIFSLFLPSITPPSPSPRWWQRRRTQGSVISWLTPGLGCVTPAAVKRRSSLIRWVVLRDQWLKDSRLRASANPVTLASSAERGTVTGAQLPSPNRVTNTCLGRVQTYRHTLFNIHRHRWRLQNTLPAATQGKEVGGGLRGNLTQVGEG